MKRRAFEKHLKALGCFLHHHGGNHDVWINERNLKRSPLPRHADIPAPLVKAICKQLGVEVPKNPK
jgi:predicted RNA binding protein YcfA (HicA-like mRNA interferase family)